MSSGGKRSGAGRPPGDKNRKKVQYRIDAVVAEKFAENCKHFQVPLNAILETLMNEWMSEITELKGTEEFSKRRCSPDNVARLNEKRIEHNEKRIKYREIQAVSNYLARKRAVAPDILDTSEYLKLVKLSGYADPIRWLIRLWGNCQNRHYWGLQPEPSQIVQICRYEGPADADTFVGWLIKSGFLDHVVGQYVVHAPSLIQARRAASPEP